MPTYEIIRKPSTTASLLVGTACLLTGTYVTYSEGTESMLYATGMLVLGLALFFMCIESLTKESVTEGMLSLTFSAYCIISASIEVTHIVNGNMYIICTIPFFILTPYALYRKGHRIRAFATMISIASPIGELLSTSNLDFICIISGLLFILHFTGIIHTTAPVCDRASTDDGRTAYCTLPALGFSLLTLFSISESASSIITTSGCSDLMYTVCIGIAVVTMLISFVMMSRTSSILGSFFLVTSIYMLTTTYVDSIGFNGQYVAIFSFIPLIFLLPRYYGNGYTVLTLMSITAVAEGFLLLANDSVAPAYAVAAAIESVLAVYSLVSVWRTSDDGVGPLPLIGDMHKEDFI